MQMISIAPEQAAFPPDLHEIYAQQLEGHMTDTERQILDSLYDINKKLNGTNGDPGIMTRMRLLEERTGERATTMRHIKSALITAIIATVVAFVAGRLVLPPTPSPHDAEQRLKTLESELGAAREQLKAKDQELKGLSEQIKQVAPRRTSRRPAPPLPAPPAPNLIQRYKEDVWADQSSQLYGSARLASMPNTRSNDAMQWTR